jgi:Zn ribbon nucleic-acid-binding protein
MTAKRLPCPDCGNDSEPIWCEDHTDCPKCVVCGFCDLCDLLYQDELRGRF